VHEMRETIKFAMQKPAAMACWHKNVLIILVLRVLRLLLLIHTTSICTLLYHHECKTTKRALPTEFAHYSGGENLSKTMPFIVVLGDLASLQLAREFFTGRIIMCDFWEVFSKAACTFACRQRDFAHNSKLYAA